MITSFQFQCCQCSLALQTSFEPNPQLHPPLLPFPCNKNTTLISTNHKSCWIPYPGSSTFASTCTCTVGSLGAVSAPTSSSASSNLSCFHLTGLLCRLSGSLTSAFAVPSLSSRNLSCLHLAGLLGRLPLRSHLHAIHQNPVLTHTAPMRQVSLSMTRTGWMDRTDLPC